MFDRQLQGGEICAADVESGSIPAGHEAGLGGHQEVDLLVTSDWKMQRLSDSRQELFDHVARLALAQRPRLA